jgi:Zn-dependent protease
MILLIFQILVLVYSVVIHEVAHGFMANSLGDQTAKHLGRLTLNPIKHLDMFGSFILPLLIFISSGFQAVFGYAKPVPYNPHNLSDQKYGPAKVAFAGPASNLVLAILFGLFFRFLPDALSSGIMPDLIRIIIITNINLAIFNLIPVPPLDGHWILMTFLPPRFTNVKMFLYRFSLPLLLFVIFFLFPMIRPIMSLIFRLITGVEL